MRHESNQLASASGIKVVVLVSSYHEQVTNKLASGAFDAFIGARGKDADYLLVKVAGAWELPIIAQTFASQGKHDAIVALGCIIKGETTHDNVIAHAIAQGLMQVSLQWKLPVSMGILTCQNIEQALARAGGSCGNKGTESMLAALATAAVMREQA